jgi:two-component sensor histidine kinase
LRGFVALGVIVAITIPFANIQLAPVDAFVPVIQANLRAMVHLPQSDAREGFRKAIEGRIEALANVHSLFVQSHWAGAELGRLVEQELSPYSRCARSAEGKVVGAVKT